MSSIEKVKPAIVTDFSDILEVALIHAFKERSFTLKKGIKQIIDKYDKIMKKPTINLHNNLEYHRFNLVSIYNNNISLKTGIAEALVGGAEKKNDGYGEEIKEIKEKLTKEDKTAINEYYKKIKTIHETIKKYKETKTLYDISPSDETTAETYISECNRLQDELLDTICESNKDVFIPKTSWKPTK